MGVTAAKPYPILSRLMVGRPVNAPDCATPPLTAYATVGPPQAIAILLTGTTVKFRLVYDREPVTTFATLTAALACINVAALVKAIRSIAFCRFPAPSSNGNTQQLLLPLGWHPIIRVIT